MSTKHCLQSFLTTKATVAIWRVQEKRLIGCCWTYHGLFWDSLGPIKNKPRIPTHADYLSDNAHRTI